MFERLLDPLCTPAVISIVGQRFNRLVVLERAGSTAQQKALWFCVCDCGEKTTVTTGALRSGATKSCGCFIREAARIRGLANRTIDYENVKCHVCGKSLKDEFLAPDGSLKKRLDVSRLDSIVCKKCFGDISRRNWDKKNEAGRAIPISISQQEVAIGSVLGDGSLELVDGCINDGLAIKHGLKQESYLLWKASLLGALVSKVDYPKDRVRLRTIKHPFFTKMASDFIVSGRKSVSKKWASRMGPLAFAIWYLDDGNLLPNRIGKKGKFSKPTIRFSTNSFTDEETRILKDELKRKIGVTPGRCQWFQRFAFGVELPEPKRFFGIRLHGDDVEKFLAYIRPHVDWEACGLGYKADTTLRGPLDNKHTRRRAEMVIPAP